MRHLIGERSKTQPFRSLGSEFGSRKGQKNNRRAISFFAGFYIYIEASRRNFGDEARLLSDWMKPNETVCVKFWYHMHGSDIGNLSIYLKTNQSETLVWMVSGDQGNRWRYGQTALNSTLWFKVSIQFSDNYAAKRLETI